MPSPLDRRVWLEAKSLSTNSYEVIILCPKSNLFPKIFEVIDNIKIYRYPQIIEGKNPISIFIEYVFSFLFLFFYQIYISFNYQIQIIQYCNPPDFLPLTSLGIRAFRNYKTVFDQHDVSPELWLAKGYSRKSIIYRILLFLESYSLKHCDHIIFASESFRDKALLNGTVTASKCTLIKTAPSRTFGDSVEQTSFKNNSHTRFIGYVGRMGSQDGLHILIEAFAFLVHEFEYKDIGLKLIGDGPQRKELEKLAKRLQVYELIFFLGYLSDEIDLCSELKSCELAVCPDLPTEMNHMASMNKITEYMALNLPIVQFNLKQNVMTAGKFSYVVLEANALQLAKGIQFILDDEKLAKSLAEGAKARFVNSLCWETQETKLIQVYNSIYALF